MNEFTNNMMFSEEEKQILTARLQTAARTARKPVRFRARRLVCVAAAAALMLTAAAGALNGAFTGLKLHINGQAVEAAAVMTMNADGSATVTVTSPSAGDTHITDPNGTLPMIVLSGDAADAAAAQAPIVQDKNPAADPYTVYEENGRLLLHINGYIPIDVTDRLAEGVSFVYTDETGASRSATVSGTVDDYTVE